MIASSSPSDQMRVLVVDDEAIVRESLTNWFKEDDPDIHWFYAGASDLADLVKKDVGLIFIPHVVRMPHPNQCKDSYLCPITQAEPYFLAKAFPDRRLLSPVLEFINGYQTCTALVDMAVSDLGVSRDSATDAWDRTLEFFAEHLGE